MRIRPADSFDVSAITEIYNHEVLLSSATLDTEKKSEQQQHEWLKIHRDKQLPVLVAEGEGKVVGWASLSEWSPRAGYAITAEISVYVADGHRQKGIGRQLMREVCLAGEVRGIHAVLARITHDNIPSITLHESEGFFRAGVLREVGTKFHKLYDVIILEKFLRAKAIKTTPNQT